MFVGLMLVPVSSHIILFPFLCRTYDIILNCDLFDIFHFEASYIAPELVRSMLRFVNEL